MLFIWILYLSRCFLSSSLFLSHLTRYPTFQFSLVSSIQAIHIRFPMYCSSADNFQHNFYSHFWQERLKTKLLEEAEACFLSDEKLAMDLEFSTSGFRANHSCHFSSTLHVTDFIIFLLSMENGYPVIYWCIVHE